MSARIIIRVSVTFRIPHDPDFQSVNSGILYHHVSTDSPMLCVIDTIAGGEGMVVVVAAA